MSPEAVVILVVVAVSVGICKLMDRFAPRPVERCGSVWCERGCEGWCFRVPGDTQKKEGK